METTDYAKSSFLLAMSLLIVAVAGLLTVPQDARAATSLTELSSKDASSTETSLGGIVVDAIRAQAKSDIGFITASELKDVTLPKGEILANDISGALAYRNDPVAVLTLKGDQIQKALERSVGIYSQKNLGFLQISGMKFTFDSSKPRDSRVVSVTIGDKPLDTAKMYTVGVSNSLANGALGYFRVWQKEQITKVGKDTVAQALDAYLLANPQLDYKKGRISGGK